MKLHADKPAGNYIQSYRDGGLLINGQWHPTALIVSGESVSSGFRAPGIEGLSVADLADALALEPEVIILGTGPTHRFPPHAVMVEIMGRGVGFEAMATPAACRTYNILLAEDRRVVGILL